MLLAFLLWTTDNLRPWTGVLSFCGGLLGVLGTLYGFLSKRASTEARTASDAAKTSSDETLELVKKLLGLLEARQEVADRVFAAYLEKDAIASPEKVREIAVDAVQPVLDPMREFFAAVELIEHRRTHRPETDVIAILEGARAA